MTARFGHPIHTEIIEDRRSDGIMVQRVLVPLDGTESSAQVLAILCGFFAVGEVELVGKPLNPPDAEKVVSVDVVSLEEIVRRFQAQNRPEMAQLYQLAASRR